MYTIHSTGGLIPTQSQRSREAAERHAILMALANRRQKTKHKRGAR